MKTKLILASLLILATQAMAQKLFTLEELNFGGKNYSVSVPKRWSYSWQEGKLIFRDGDKTVQVNPATGKTTEYQEPEKQNRPNPRGLLEWCKASNAAAFHRDDNLWVRYADGRDVQISKDGSREIVYGKSVHRDEFGIYKGTFWSNSGRKLAFYRMDQSMVADYPQVNTFRREAELEPDKYPMAGMTSHQVTVGIFDLETEKTVYLNVGDPTDRYFTNIAWGPDDRTLYLYELNRDQNRCTLDAYDAETGNKVRTLYTETSDKYVEPLHPITFLPWDSSKFIYWSWKDGFTHLYLMDTAGKELGQLTGGKWVVKDIVGFCPATKSAILITKEADDLQRNIYRLDLKTKKRTLLDNGKGVHQAKLSEDGLWLVDTWQEPDVPRACAVTNTKTGKSTLLQTAPDPWEGWYQPIFESGSVKADDGVTDLYWRMVKPADFDPAKKYPTVVYVYGGPHAHSIEASWHWASRSWETYMAQKGYILFILDNRGSEDRGRDFEQATFRHLGQVEMRDQMSGVNYLKTLPYVDADRIGVHGWSFGGFMTTSLMLNYPDVFKVGVAGGPVIDWKWYEVMYGERYMDTPEQNPEGYEQTSLINKAKNLKGKLQIIIGMNDPTVVPQHALQFLNACAEAGTQPDFFVYPGEGHNMAGHKSVHLHERITQYFEDYLKPAKR
ncbi:MAG: DPP IV N-terminal domain-containing protein [Bacteroidaceae bacterium]|nr:DPP IV N-terminal domain-containing protein [Bacteroidaceae bacterium]